MATATYAAYIDWSNIGDYFGYKSSVLSHSPSIYLRLGESSGTTATDSSGNGRNGTYTGTPLAAQFTSANSEYLSRASNGGLQVGNNDFWIAGWFYLDTTGTRLLASKDDVGVNREYALNTSPNSVDWQTYSGASGSGWVGHNHAVTLNASTWHFVIAYYDDANKLAGSSIDGGAFTTSARATGVYAGSAAFNLGRFGSGFYMDGRMDAWAIGKSPVGGIAALATTIRDALYNSGAGISSSDVSSTNATAWGLVSWWDLDEASGSRADAIGTNTLTDNNTVTQATGKTGKRPTLGATGALTRDTDTAALFDGSSGYVTVPSTAALNITGDITLEAWVYLTSYANYSMIVTKNSGSDIAYEWRIEQTTGLPQLLRAGVSVQGSNAVPLNTWTYLAVTSVSGTITHYKNASTNGTGSLSAGTSNSGALIIGQRDDLAANLYFIGTLDEVAIYPTGLSAANLLANYNAGLGTHANVVSSRVRSAPGISLFRGKDQIRSLSPASAGKMSLTLDNQSNDYSPENSSSPIYGSVVPGHLGRIDATYSGTTYHLATDVLDVPTQHPEKSQKSIDLPFMGTLSRLAGVTISTALYSNVTTDVALGYLLDAAGWPAADRVLDTGNMTLAWWWLDNEDAFSALNTLVTSEGPGACVYEDGQGRLHFESRHYRLLTARCIASQVTFSDSGSEPLFSEPFTYDQGLKNIINSCSMTFKTRSAQALSAVWSLGTTVILAPNEVRKYTTQLSDPCTAAVAPVNATDYTVSAGSLASVTLDRTSGTRITVTLTAGTSGATVVGLQIRAQSVTVQSTTTISNTVDASASITAYKLRPFTLATRAELDSVNTAQDFVNSVVGAYKSPRPTLLLSVNNDNATRLTQILTREVSDLVTAVESSSSVNFPAFIESIGHQIDAAGLHHVAQLGVEKAASSLNTFVLDSTTNGILDTNVLGS